MVIKLMFLNTPTLLMIQLAVTKEYDFYIVTGQELSSDFQVLVQVLI
jgi:hypothetical protein